MSTLAWLSWLAASVFVSYKLGTYVSDIRAAQVIAKLKIAHAMELRKERDRS